VIHDANSHPSAWTYKEAIKELYSLIHKKMCINNYKNVVLLSENVRSLFQKKVKRFRGNIILIKLCSNLVVDEMTTEKSLLDEEYFLFFGRIEKYKGIEYVLRAYKQDVENILPLLVLAGKGDLSKIENELYSELKDRVRFLNCYISDDELANLVRNSKAVVLPYIEASQSGIIPIAYQYGKPVVASKLDGLTENIIEMKTGFTFEPRNYVQLYEILKKLALSQYDVKAVEERIRGYYQDAFDWGRNIQKIIENL
jgi:glycosyltransferase involved in cell wall biosynthesis